MRCLWYMASALVIAVAATYLLRPNSLQDASHEDTSLQASEVRDSPEAAVTNVGSSEVSKDARPASSGSVAFADGAPPTSSAEAFRAIEDALQRPPRPEMLALDSTFMAEAIDLSWASGRESDIYGVISQMTDLEIIALQVECRTSMCRIQLTQRVSPQAGQPGSAALSTFGRLFDRLGVDHRPVISATDRYGTAISLVYLPRRDQTERSVNVQ